MKNEHTYQDLSEVVQQIYKNKALPPELKEADSLLLFVWSMATINWKMAATLFEELLAQHAGQLSIWGGLLAHLIQLGPTAEAQSLMQRMLPKLLKLHLQLAEKSAIEQHGLLHEKVDASDELFIDPLTQTFWIWSNQAIIELGKDTDLDILPLILLNEVSIFEINARLWMPEHAAYGRTTIPTNKLSSTSGFRGFLPLFAAIPDQEVAEQMYVKLKAMGLPLDPEETSEEIPDLPPVTAFMLYVGLLEYEMHAAAQNLKRRYALLAKESSSSLANRSVTLLWEKY